MSRRSRSRGFTLIELLVVIAIIALLLSILVPALNNARQMAYVAKCQSNLKACWIALNLYAEDNHGFLPLSLLPGQNTQAEVDNKVNAPFAWDPWTHVIAQFPPNWHWGWKAPMGYCQPEATACPVKSLTGTDPNGPYGLNHVLTWYPDSTNNPGALYYHVGGYFRLASAKMPSELYLVCDAANGCTYISPDFRHLNKHNMMWADGHIRLSAQNGSCWGGNAPYAWARRPMYNGDPPLFRLDN